MPGPADVILFLSGLPGSLLYYAVSVCLLALAAILALRGRRNAPAEGGVLAVAAIGAFVVQVALVIAGAAALLTSDTAVRLLPPLDRGGAFIIIALLIWGCALPRRGRLGQVVVGLLVVAALWGLGLSLAAALQPAAVGASYNRSTQETAWEAAKIVLLASGIILLIFRRAAGWGAGLLMLTVFLAGHALHFRFPAVGQDYPGAERLAGFFALPLFCLVSYLRARSPRKDLSGTVVQAEKGQAPAPSSEPVATIAGMTSPAPSMTEQTLISGSSVAAPAVEEDMSPVAAMSVADSHSEAESAAGMAELAEARSEQTRLAAELSEAHEAADRLRRRAEALVEQEHSRLEETAGLRAELEAARASNATLAAQDATRRGEIANLRAELDAVRRVADRVPDIEAEAAEARQEAEEQHGRADELAAEVGTAYTKLAGLEGQIEAMRPQLEMLDRLWVNLQVAQKQAEERAKAAPETPPDVPAQVQSLKAQESLLRRELETAHGELKRVGERVQQQHAELAAARQEARRAQDEAAQVMAKLDKARAKGERMAEEFIALQVEVEEDRSEITALADLNRQQAEELDAMQADLEAAQRKLVDADKRSRVLEADLATARQGDYERSLGLQAELDDVRRAEAMRTAELNEARAQLDAVTAERERLETALGAAQAVVDEMPALQAQLNAARQSEAELRRELELARAEAARLAAQNQAQLLQIQLSEQAMIEARTAVAEAQNRLADQHTAPAKPSATMPANGEARVPAAPKPEPKSSKRADAFDSPEIGGDGHASKAPAGAADVTLISGRALDSRQTRPRPAGEPEMPSFSETLAAPPALRSCPKLGTTADEDTRFTFSSPDHRCHALEGPVEVEIEHQVAFCLCDDFRKCPIYTGEQTQPRLPINTRVDEAEGRRRRGRLGGLFGGRK